MLKQIHLAVLWACLILVLGKCTPNGNTDTFPPTSTISRDPDDSKSPSALPDFTIVPPAPTLSEAEAYSRLAELLQGNDSCQLPCWWGIIPGKSSVQDMQATLIPLGSIADASFLGPMRGSIYFAFPKNDLLIDVNLHYWSKINQTEIEMVKIFTQVRSNLDNANREELYGTPEYGELLSLYSIHGILSKHGIPTQILVRADIIETNYTPLPMNDLPPETFEITLLYPEQGIFIRYNALGERAGDKIRGCLAKTFVELWLLSPDARITYQNVLSSYDDTWEGNWPYSKAVEEATQTTREEFYQIFRDFTDRCVETPLSIWPAH
jgi:hypothetical protein